VTVSYDTGTNGSEQITKPVYSLPGKESLNPATSRLGLQDDYIKGRHA